MRNLRFRLPTPRGAALIAAAILLAAAGMVLSQFVSFVWAIAIRAILLALAALILILARF